jgi:protocatechuate 3,4-dioxygenase alpha subunit
MTTPSQTIGPFFTHALPYPEGPLVVPVSSEHSFWVRGKVFDGAKAPVPDALIESWQVTEAFSGFGRCPTDEEGNWALHTVKAPYLVLSVFARGLLNRVVTRIYFPDQEEINSTDPVLASLGEPARATLIARTADDGYTFDIHLQGEHETTFFAL